MVNIDPIVIWKNGNNITCNILQVHIKDNCKDRSDVFYALGYKSDIDNETTIVMHMNGGLTILGAEYQNWTNDPDSNAWIYNWAAEKLNLTIL